MGFSQIAVFVVLFSATLLMSGVMIRGGFHAQQEVADGWREAEARIERQRHADLVITDVRKTGANLWVEATNTGSVTLDAGDIDLLVDGAWVTNQILDTTVDGAAQTTWPPQTDLELRLQPGPGPAPNDVALIADTGTAAYWRN